MTNEQIIKALQKIKNYCSATLLDELDCAIAVMKKLEKDGISDPLNTDFTPLKK